jgi:hypothetical protein
MSDTTAHEPTLEHMIRHREMVLAARHGLHHGMAVYAANADGTRYGLVEIGTHPVHSAVVRTDAGARYEVVDRGHCPWKPATLDALGATEFDRCMRAAIACEPA